jgi:serine/threonine protein kinase
MELRAGAQFERYLIDAPLAETRMSRVWLARDPEDNRRVALKTIRRLGDNDDLVEAARVGAVLQQMLSSCDQRVVKVQRYGEADGFFFIDMEYIDGQDVSQLVLEQGRIRPDQAVRIALEVAEMLDNLHNFSATIDGREAVSAVHGDLKPKNIRINGELAVKVLDFGTAKALSQSKPGGTRTPAWSPAYASPELLDRREMNPLSDRWALGATLYEMVTGRVPFGAGRSVEEMENLIRRRPRMPDLGVPDCPAALHAILYKLLHPEPELRYQSARELCQDLRNYPEMPTVAGYQGETVRSDLRPPPAAGTATTRRSALPPPSPAPAAARVPPSPRDLLRRVAVVLLAVLLAGWLMVREQRALTEARRLQDDLAREKVTAAAARERFSELRGTRFVWFPSREIVRLMNAGLIAEGDAIVTRFRAAPLKVADWQRARSYFDQARENDPRREEVVGRIRICDGHIKRLRGQAEKVEALLDEAGLRLQEAAKLLPSSPDPWLGLAMLAIYNRRDPAKGEQALFEAGRRNYDFTVESRWVSVLADAYRLRADALEWEAQRIAKTLPDQAVQRLERAIAYHQKAIDWYTRIPLYGKSLSNIERSRETVGRIETRLERLRANGGAL